MRVNTGNNMKLIIIAKIRETRTMFLQPMQASVLYVSYYRVGRGLRTTGV